MTTGIRPVERHDVDAVVGLVHELADYERAAEHCLLTADQLHTALFGPSPALYGHVAEVADENGRATVVGCALWFLNFSTWRGVHGLYLEDLYVQPAHRGSGIGRALLARLAACARSEGWPGWSGRCSTGTPRRSASTGRWEPWRWTSGRCSGSTARRSRRSARSPDGSGRSRRRSYRSSPIDHARDRSLISSMNAAATTAPATSPSTSCCEGPISE